VRPTRAPHSGDTGVDISSIGFWSQTFDERDASFGVLRRTEPVSWHPPLETPHLAKRNREAGFWAITTAADIMAVSRDAARFSSQVGQVGVRPTPFRVAPNMLVTDPPDHRLYRGALASFFAPTALRRRAPRVERTVRQAVLQVSVHREFDLVTDLAAWVPARVLALLLGVPAAETAPFLVAVDAFAGGSVQAGMTEGDAIAAWMASQASYLSELFEELLRYRLARPSDDLISLLVQQHHHGPLEEPGNLISTLLLLVAAGHDTMKQLITLSVLALARNGDQRQWLLDDFDARFDTGFDELLRYASPILSFARTATADVTLGAAAIAAGDKVALFYCSGNRDAAVFPDPARLRLDRPGHGHVAFGGGGVHFCLGNSLARLELRALLSSLQAKLPAIEVGEPVFPFNDAVHRVESLPVRRSAPKPGDPHGRTWS
jgi:cytochrome P450